MIRRRRLIISIVLAVGLPAGGIFAAEYLGLDTALVISRLLDRVTGGEKSEDAPAAQLADATKASPTDDKDEDHAGASDTQSDDKEVVKGDRPLDFEAALNMEQTVFDPDDHQLPPGDRQPWRQFRKLQHLQDDIVVGKDGAVDVYRAALKLASVELQQLPNDHWRHPRNVVSAAAFILAGGDPVIARKVLSAAAEGPARRLLEAAAAFAHGNYYSAYGSLYSVNPTRLPPTIGGQVALVRAMLASPRDPRQAVYFLTMARRLAPGTLVEESALRRQITIAGELDQAREFRDLSKIYLRHFPNSHYLADFLRSYSSGLLRFFENDEREILEQLEYAQRRISDDASLYLYTLLARGATVFGRLDLARLASDRSLQLVNPSSRLAERLKLYRAAASLNEGDGEIDRFTRIDPSMLGTEDKRLLAAARLVAEQIRRPFDEIIGLDGIEALQDLPAENSAAADSGETLPVLESAEKAFRQADQLMGL